MCDLYDRAVMDEGVAVSSNAEALNQAFWDDVAEPHRQSYGADRWLDNPAALSSVVVEDAKLLAPFLPQSGVAGLDMIHLQCHIGTDTLSWVRLGGAGHRPRPVSRLATSGPRVVGPGRCRGQ